LINIVLKKDTPRIETGIGIHEGGAIPQPDGGKGSLHPPKEGIRLPSELSGENKNKHKRRRIRTRPAYLDSQGGRKAAVK